MPVLLARRFAEARDKDARGKKRVILSLAVAGRRTSQALNRFRVTLTIYVMSGLPF